MSVGCRCVGEGRGGGRSLGGYRNYAGVDVVVVSKLGGVRSCGGAKVVGVPKLKGVEVVGVAKLEACSSGRAV